MVLTQNFLLIIQMVGGWDHIIDLMNTTYGFDRNVGQSSWMGARMNPNNSSRNTMSIDDQDEEEDPEERVFELSTSSQNPGNIHYPVFNYLAHESTWEAAGSVYPVDNSRNVAQEM